MNITELIKESIIVFGLLIIPILFTIGVLFGFVGSFVSTEPLTQPKQDYITTLVILFSFLLTLTITIIWVLIKVSNHKSTKPPKPLVKFKKFNPR